ncbi:tRNA pseudouridine(13) synthase TruD [Reinekea sp.]|jgi:tRNA pseudouridine13 synthase|uniref:tRNA pseudouridine(13) synthase TruD n=1 Tax=Reinekea sp. TaxID=1970455 RepID=UPI003988D5AB
MTYPLVWPHAHNIDRTHGTLKLYPKDFKVVERLPETPSGEGEHLWLKIEKTNQNTAWVARQIAKWAGVGARDISYAGLKDRQAVTIQTFSIHLPGKETPDLSLFNIDQVTVIEAKRHGKKLRTGQLIGNHFSIRVREVEQTEEQVSLAWQTLCEQGIPNYFGPQRFGREGRNVQDGVEWLMGQKKLPKNLQSICLSAVRSYFFNELLADRIEQGTWNQLIEHDFAQFNAGKAGFYLETLANNDIERCAQGEISPCASLPGESRDEFTGLDLREGQLLDKHKDVLAALKAKRVARHFRKLRVFPETPELSFEQGDPVFSFFLPAGSYATAVMTELFDWKLGSLSADWNE